MKALTQRVGAFLEEDSIISVSNLIDGQVEPIKRRKFNKSIKGLD
jgi:hypothetical protein